MADADRFDAILAKLKERSRLTPEEISHLRTRIDQLETLASEPHHHTHTTPGSHYSHHDGAIAEVAGFLDKEREQR